MMLLSSTYRHYQASCFKIDTRAASLLLRGRRCSPFSATSISHLSSSSLSLYPTCNENHGYTATSRSFPRRRSTETTQSSRYQRRNPRRRHFTSVHLLTNERLKAVLEGSSSSTSLDPEFASLSGGGSAGSARFGVGRRPYPSLDDVRTLKVKELRLELSARGLETSGKKSELKSRLTAALEIEGEEHRNVSTEGDASLLDDHEAPPSGAVEEESLPTTTSSKPLVDPTSLDLERPYFLMVRVFYKSNLDGIGVGLALYTSDETMGENTSRAKPSVRRGNEIWSGRVYLEGKRSMFEADYSGLILAFKYATDVLKIRKLHLQVHNDVLVKQLEGKYKVNKPVLRNMMEEFYNHEDQMLSSSAMDYVVISTFASDDSPTVLGQAEDALAKRRSSNLLSDEWQIVDPLEAAVGVVAGNPIATEDVAFVDQEVEEIAEIQPVQPKEERQQADSNQKHQNDSIPIMEDSTSIDPSKTYLLQFDGGSRGNPGIAGAGMVLYEINNDAIMEEKKEIWCGWKFHSEEATNNVAEYLGLLCGLKCAKSLGIKHLHVEGDSQLIVKQINGEYRCREKHLKLFYDAAKDIFDNDFDSYEIRHIRRNENSRADFLANHAMDTQESGGFVATD